MSDDVKSAATAKEIDEWRSLYSGMPKLQAVIAAYDAERERAEKAGEKLATAVGGSAWFKTLREEIAKEFGEQLAGKTGSCMECERREQRIAELKARLRELIHHAPPHEPATKRAEEALGDE